MQPADRGGSRRQAGAPRRPEAPPLACPKPGELPSVLRTSGDLAPALKQQHAPSGAAAAALHATRPLEPASSSSRPTRPAAPSDAFAAAAATLPKLDGAAAGASALLASHAPRTAGSPPPPPHQRHTTPERPRAIKQQQQQQQQQQQEALCSSGDGPQLAAKATGPAAVQQPWPGSSSSVGRAAAPDGGPAGASVGVGALPASLLRKLAAGDGADSRAAAAAEQMSPRAGAAAAGEGVQLLRPVDPTKPGYYWKPVQAAAEAAAKPGGGDNILGYQLLQEVAGLVDSSAAQASHTLQRRSMLMRLPLGTEHLVEAVPGAIQDRDGHACLLVLPSDQPSSRKEALAVEALLGELLKDPASAIPKACQWRASTLAALCAESLAVVAEGLKHKGPAGGWQLRQLNRKLTRQVLGSGMVEALDAFITSSSVSTTAEKMAGLLNSKEATAQVGAAAIAAVAAAAAAAAAPPASACRLQRRGVSGGAADACAAVVEQQQQQPQQGSTATCTDAKGSQRGAAGSSALESLRMVTGSPGLSPAAKAGTAGAAALATATAAAAGASSFASGGSKGSLASPAASASGTQAASPALPLASAAPADGSEASSSSPRQASKRPVSPAPPLQQGIAAAADTAAGSSSSISGQQPQQQQQAAAPEKPGGQQQPEAGSAAGQLQLRGPGALYSLALAASICMADLVRQVEVACVERGRALAYAWNCSVGAAEAVVGELRCQNRQLLAVNGEMAAQQAELARELKGVEFLRREAMRFRKAMEEAQAEASAATADNAQLRGRVAAAEGAVGAVEAYARRRLAQLRWRNAFATLGTWSQQSTIQSGLAGPGSQQLLQMVMMLDRMVNAVKAVERRKAAWGRKATTEAYEAWGKPLVTDVVQAVALGPQVVSPRRGGDGGGGADGALVMLGALTPEARAMVLAAMPAGQRWRVLEAMRDEERAEVVIAMSMALRKEAGGGVERGCWERTTEAIRNNSVLSARYLLAMELDAAAADFHAWGRYQQLDALTALDAHTAAGLLTRLPQELRRELLGMLEPYAAANIVQAMMPPPAAAAMESLDIKKAMAILVAMDPNKAADLLTEMGPPHAASKLVLMDADARNSIIESMAPRVAAVTLTSMGGSLTAAGEGGRPGSAEMLSLGGGPVMGAMSELDAANAYSIMSYMSVQDKAALLASMDPDVVARLLGVMDPHEAVLLLAALGDDSARLVSEALSSDERSRLIGVLQTAEAQAAAGGSPGQRAKRNGSSQQPDAAMMERLVDAYEAIEAGAMEEDEEEEQEEEPPPPPAASSKRCSKAKASRPSKPPQRSVGVQVGSGGGGGNAAGRSTAAEAGGAAAAAAAPLAAEASAAVLAAGAGDGDHRQVQASVSEYDNSDDVAVDAASEAAAGDAAAGAAFAAGAAGASAKGAVTSRSKPPQQQRAAKPPKPRAAAGDGGTAAAQGRRASRPDEARAARQEEQRRTSTCSSYEDLTIEEAAPAEAVQPQPAGDSSTTTSTKARAPAAKPAAARAPAGAGAKSRKPAPAAGDADGAPPPRAFRRGSSSVGLAGADAVPPLPLGGVPGGGAARMEASVVSFEECSPPASARRGKYVDEEPSAVAEEADASSDSTPRNTAGAAASGSGAAAAAAPTRSTTTRAAAPARNAAGAAASAAAGRNALREALRMQATKRRAPVAKEASQPAGAGDDDADAPTSSGSGGGASAPEAAPQARLGRLPKNARLIEAMAQHKNAKPKPKGWLMAVVDCIYKEGETLLRKLGRSDMIKKQSVPEIVFAYFHNKYGQRALVNENVGSLVNTLSLHQHADLRLEAFARLLSEEWDVSIFIDFLSATGLCMQTAKLACIEYPRETGKDEQYAWVCLYKATWVADAILGARTAPVRERFVEFLRMAARPADEADVERLRRERREAAAKELAGGGGAGGRAGGADGGELPNAFFKLPRIRFLLILCKEIWRINRFIASFAEDRFGAMDVQHAGRVDVVPVRAFVKAMSPGASDAQVSDNINAFVSTAEGAARDVAPESVAVASVTELTREAFVAGVVNTAPVREHIKANLLAPARLEEDDAEAQVFCNLLTVLMTRHTAALLPFWQAALPRAGEAGRLLAAQVVALSAPGSGGDARLKGYVSLLLGLVSATLQRYLDGVLAPGADEDGAASAQLEEGLARLEDAALIVTGGRSIAYLLAPEDGGLALARMTRLPLSAQLPAMGAVLLQHRRMAGTMAVHAARVLQAAWRRRQREARAAAAAAAHTAHDFGNALS